MPLQLQLPAEDDRRASLARDRWHVLAHEQQQQVAAAAGAGMETEAAAAAAGAAEGGPSAAAAAAGDSEGDEMPASQQPALPPRLYPEAELVVEPEEDGSDDDGAGRDEHVRKLVQQYRQAAEQVGLPAGSSRQLIGTAGRDRGAAKRCAVETFGVAACQGGR